MITGRLAGGRMSSNKVTVFHQLPRTLKRALTRETFFNILCDEPRRFKLIERCCTSILQKSLSLGLAETFLDVTQWRTLELDEVLIIYLIFFPLLRSPQSVARSTLLAIITTCSILIVLDHKRSIFAVFIYISSSQPWQIWNLTFGEYSCSPLWRLLCRWRLCSSLALARSRGLNRLTKFRRRLLPLDLNTNLRGKKEVNKLYLFIDNEDCE